MEISDPPMFTDVPDVEIWAFGNVGQGGRIKLRRGDESGPVDLPPAVFDTLVVLIREVQLTPSADPWVRPGFITMDQLCQKLKQLTQGTPNNLDPDRLNAPRYVMRLRQLFAKAVAPRLGEKLPSTGTPEWTKQLIEKHPHLGYRLAVPAERLHLVLQQEAAEANRV